MLRFKIFRKKIISKPIAIVSAATMLFQLVYPAVAFSLTAGPSQPEVQSFEPVSTTQMVDPFTGDFTYNIPLLDCGGYPINLSYHAGIGMDQEASWVGLGWNINPGVINRNMRGLPDDFKGDVIEKKTHMKQFIQVGVDPRFRNKAEREVLGYYAKKGNVKKATPGFFDNVNVINSTLNYEIYYNNYKGVGYKIQSNLPTNRDNNNSNELQASIGLGYDSQEGISIAPSLVYKRKIDENKINDKKIKPNVSASIGYHSRSGLTSLGIGRGISKSNSRRTEFDGVRFNKSGGGEVSSSYNFQNVSYTPISKPNQFSFNYTQRFKYYDERSASTSPESRLGTKININVGVNGIHNVTNTYKSYGYLNEQYRDNYALSDLNSEGDNSFSKYTNNLRPSSNTYDILGLSGQGTGGSYKPNKNYFSSLAEPMVNINSISNVSIPFELGIPGFRKQLKLEQTYKIGTDVNVVSYYGKDVKIGADPSLTYVWGNSGLWEANSGNKALEKLDAYRKEQTVNTLNEKVYYKNAAEKTVYDAAYLNKMGGTAAARMEINANFGNANIFDDYNTTNKYITGNGEYDFSAGIDKKGRAKRSEVINYLNAKEASNFGLEKTLNSYSFDATSKTLTKGPDISRVDPSIRKDHHISEITSTTADGARYVYGLPVYNTEQYERSFNVGEKTIGEEYSKHGLTTYDANDISMQNAKGVDEFFHEEKMPSYVHSWMLTAVLSSDYVDITGDGPTPDDLGGYTKFNYEKLKSNNVDDVSGLYNWRSPTGPNKAHHNRGLKSDYTDDKGSVVVGKKEIWYLQSVETKTHIAVFIMSSRKDGLSVNENGQFNDYMKMKKLDRIELYNRNELLSASGSSTKVPIKTVNFEYSYDLCPNTLNNNTTTSGGLHPLSSYNNAIYNYNNNFKNGKLTLHKVWFTYGKNPKGALSPYIFEYKGLNPAYASKAMDRWGNYKPWNYHNSSGTYNNDKISNAENPYVPQNETLVDQWAGAWNLTDIKLPSGGKMHVDYEADDYAYVQDKQASQMYKILGLNRDGLPSGLSNKLYNKNSNFDVNNYIVFECPTNTTKEEIIGDLNSVYGSFYTVLNPSGVPLGFDERKDHIQGYMDIEEAVVSNGIGYIKVKHAFLGDKDNASTNDDIHPMTKQAFQFIREQANFLAYPGYAQKSDQSAKALVGSLFSFIPEFARTILGHEHYMRERDYASTIDLSNSYIKLYNPKGNKKGGGHRVKRITMNDNWDVMTNYDETNFVTGQEFDYTTNEKVDDPSTKIISSGVASWEPLVGGDENTHRNRIQFTKTGSYSAEEKKLFAPNNFRYEEGPIGESFYPSAVVGYSKITIKNLKPTGVNPDLLKKHGTGITVQEFYTAKDFPTIATRTDLDVYIRKNLALSLLGISKEKATASQGFAIELNDMHGKPKSVKNYSEYDYSKVLNGSIYHYKVDNENAVTKHLSNLVKIINKKGETVDNQPVGIEVEMFSNAQSSEHNALTGSVAVNLHVIFPNSGTPPLFPVVSVVPSMSYSRSVVNVITTTKVINRFGLIDRVEAIEDGATLTTYNEAWDAETGEVIYSRLQNEYGDYDYSITKPAHWVEAGMGGAYQNIGTELILKTTGVANPGEVGFYTVGKFGSTTESINNVLYPGDELIPTDVDDPDKFVTSTTDINGNIIETYVADYLANTSTTKKYWVLSTSSNKANLIDADGNPLPHHAKPYFFKIVRSGHRNLLGAPAEQMTLKNPLPTNWATATTLDNVLNGSALLYSDKWQTYFKPPMLAKLSCQNEVGTMDVTEPSIDGNLPNPAPIFRPFADVDFSNSPNNQGQNVTFCGNNKKPGDFANPFTLGIRGNWRPWYSMVYYDRTNANAERTQARTVPTDANTTNTKTAGVISNYVPFYQYTNASSNWTSQWLPGNAVHNQWLWQNRATMIGPNSEEIENENAMNIFSSALYGYQKKLPVAVTGNSKYQDMMFDGFEEYDEGFFTILCPPIGSQAIIKGYPEPNFSLENLVCNNYWHWPVWKGIANGKGRISSQNAHTGKRSFMVPSNVSIPLDNNDLLMGTNGISGGQFFLSKNDFIPVFSPDNTTNSATEYLISYWTYGNGNITIKNASGTSLTVTAIGTPIVVDGWKRFEGKITLPQGQRINELLFINNNPQVGGGPPSPTAPKIPVLFDDLRILPFMSNMSSYVYDNLTLRLMATLSENNFATFYEYDEEGSLIRTKVETEKGIMTVQESRSSLRKK